MNNYKITLEESSVGLVEGWIATVAKDYAPKHAKSKIAIKESLYYPTMDEAWASIKKEAKDLDYENDDISFNKQKVNSYEEVQQKVALL